VKKLYVGNLPFSATEAEVNEMFAKHGTVLSTRHGAYSAPVH